MVRFFGKPTKSTAAKKTAAEPPASKTAAAANGAATAPAPAAPERKTPVRRTTRSVTRAPRRDWAAEAAAAPVESPAPRPTTLAASPADENEPGAPAKRRRGTRGGRGRKKPVNGAAPDTMVDAVADTPAGPTAGPATLEAVVARQSAVLESFARDVSVTLKELRNSVADLQSKLGERGQSQTAHPRVGIFVDVPNLIYASERRKVQIDFGRVLDYFTRDRELVRATAYAPITDDPQAKLETQRFVHHFLGHPYRIITKPLKRFADGSMKANFDIELAVDILTMSDRLDIVVLMSGDGDFRRVVELIASRGVRVEVAAFSETASTELKTVADRYIDFGAHIEDFRVK